MSTEEDDTSIKSKEPNELQQILHHFLERSTLPAMGVMQQKISLFWRIVWICVVLTGIFLAIMQSVEVVNNYLSNPMFFTLDSYPTFLTEVEKVNTSVFFPAVTLCSQNLIDWKRVIETNHSIGDVIKKAAAEKRPGENSISRRVRLEDLLMSELHRLNWDEKIEYLYTYDEWLKLCIVQDVTKDSDYCNISSPFATVYSPYYGPCVTINTGLDKESTLSVDAKSKMVIIAEFPHDMEFRYMARSNGLLVSIHAPGSAPVIPWSKYVEILPGEWLYATMDVYDIKRLPAPYASACSQKVKIKVENITLRSPYQSESTPYEYSREECMSTCFAWKIYYEYECINPFSAVNQNMESFMKANLCGNNTIEHGFFQILEDECSEICPKRCRELMYDWAPMTLNIPKHKGYLYDILDEVSEKKKIDIEEMVYVTLKMDSTVYVIGEETAKYEIEDVFGAIGGNLGLWIGVSILTIFEVFELITSLVVYFMKKLFLFCFKKK